MKTNIEYHEGLMKIMPENIKIWFKREEEILQKIVKKNSRVLVVACGDGREINCLMDKTQEIIGVDNDVKAVAKAKSNFKGTSVEIILADARSLPFEDASFDYVTCMASFTNFGDAKLEVLSEMNRVLKASGKIIVSAYAEDALSTRMKLYNSLKIPIKNVDSQGKVVFDFEGSNISEQFARPELEYLFVSSGLNVKKIEKVGVGYIAILSKKH